MKLPLLHAFIVLICYISSLVYSMCSITGMPSGMPPKKNLHPTNPIIYDNEVFDICPTFTGKPVCCNKNQRDALCNVSKVTLTIAKDFQDLDILFGTDCPICAVNMKRLWCEFACNPNQSDFTTAGDYTKVKIGPKEYAALLMDFHISLNTTCNLYASCSKIPEISMMASSAMGFLQFQGDHSVERGNTIINMVFHDEVKGQFKPLSFNVNPCSTKVENGTLDGYKNVSTCPCQ